MPVLTGPACLVSEECPIVPIPSANSTCTPTLSYGGVNDLYVIPCTEEMTETNILDVDWWRSLITNNVLGQIGLGLGSIAKQGTRSEKISSDRAEQIVNATWALTYEIKLIDKSGADITRTQVNALLHKYSKFLVIARMSDGENTVLPIGRFSISDFDWIVPADFEEVQTISFVVSWIEFGIPKVYDVAGLSAVIPKA